MLQRLVGPRISLAFQPGSDVAPVRLDPGQELQVLMNRLRQSVFGRRQLLGNGPRPWRSTASRTAKMFERDTRQGMQQTGVTMKRP